MIFHLSHQHGTCRIYSSDVALKMYSHWNTLRTHLPMKKLLRTGQAIVRALLLSVLLIQSSEIPARHSPLLTGANPVQPEHRLLSYNLDIEATSFTDPEDQDTISSASTFLPRALFTNTGLLSQSNIPVRYKILNSSYTVVYDQTASITTLPPGASVIVDFPALNLPVAGTYTIQMIAQLPLDQNTANDGLMGTITVMDPLCGTYTIGSAQPYPFNTLSSAIARLNAVGMSCAVTFELEDALYASSETFPIIINAIEGAGPVSPFILKPKSGTQPVISGNSATGLIRLEDADWITINGAGNGLNFSQNQDLTFLNFSNSAACIIGLHSSGSGAGATYNTIINTRMIGTSTLSNAGTLFGIYSGGSSISMTGNGTDNDNNTFQHNYISRVQYGIYSAGGSVSNLNEGTVILENKMDDAEPDALTGGGIYLRFENSPTIVDNSISVIRHNGTNGFTGTAFGIALGLIPSNTNTVFTGDDVTGAVINGNNLKEIQQLHPSGYSAFGIVVNDVGSGNFFIRNNMINRVYAPSTGNEIIAGILYGGGSNGYIDFNTIKFFGPGAGAHSFAIAYGDGDPKIYLRNNIFSFTRILTNAYRLCAIGTLSSTFINLVSGPNVFGIGGGSPLLDAYGRSGGLGFSGTNYTLLSNWQTATGQEAASFDASALFVATDDLHLTAANTGLNNTALNIGVTLDIDHETRCSSPDFGADEFSTSVYSVSGPLSFCPGGNVTLSASGGTGYLWSTGATTSSITTSTAGNYSVTVFEGACPSLFTSVVTVTGVMANAPGIARQRCYGGSGYERLGSVISTPDGGQLFVGESYSDDQDASANYGSADLWVVKTDAQGNIMWEQNYGGADTEWGYKAISTADGGYLIASVTLSNNGDVSGNHGAHDAWILKISSTGTLLWQHCIGGSNSDRLTALASTPDGGYILAGRTVSNDGDVTGNHGAQDAWLVKINAAGALQWQKCLGGSDDELANSIITLADGGFLICGTTYSNNGDVSGHHGSGDAWVVKTDASGNILWQKTIGGTGTDSGVQINAAAAGGFILTGVSNSNDGDVSGHHGGKDAWVVKLSEAGNITWQTMLGGSGDEEGTDILQDPDGGYIISAFTNSNNGDVSGAIGNYDCWLVKINSAGLLQWQRTLGGTQDDRTVLLLPLTDGAYLITANSYSNDFDVSGLRGDQDYWVLKMSYATISPANPVNVCDAPDVLLTALPGYSYAWSNGATSQSILVTGAGNYTLTVNGCYVSDPVTVNFSSTPTAVITPSGPLGMCPGGTVNLQASGGTYYLWNTGATSSSVTVATADNFTVTVSDGICSQQAVISTSFLTNPYAVPSFSHKDCYGGSGLDLFSDMKRTPDGGYIMVGSTYSSDGDVSMYHGDRDAWVVKTSASGEIEWQRALGGTDIDWGQSIALSGDGGYLMAGATLSNNGDVSGNHGVHDGWVVKLSSSGTLLWQRAYGGSSYDFLYHITPSGDGGFLVLGKTTSADGDLATASGTYEAWIFKIDGGGIIQWSSRYGGSLDEKLHAASLCSDGGFIVAGGTHSNTGVGSYPGENAWLLKLSASGVLEWQRVHGDNNDEAFTSVVPTADGGYFAGGYSNSSGSFLPDNHGNKDFFAAKFNAAGILQWKKSYGGSLDDNANSVIQAPDGGFLLLGNSMSDDQDVSWNSGAKDIWLVKTNPSGTLLWQKNIGGSADDDGMVVLQNPDGSIQAGCSTASPDGDINCSLTSTNFWNARLSFATITASGPTTICDGTPLTLSANPGSSYLWSTGETTQSITVNSSGTYTVTVDECYTSEALTVTFGTAPLAAISTTGPAAFCPGGSVILNGSGGGTYLWSNGASTATIEVFSGGTYTLTVSSGTCSSQSTIAVTEQLAPDASFSGLWPEYCTNDPAVTMSPAISGGVFSGPGISGSNFDPAMAGVGTHRIVYTLSNGTCSDSSVIYTDVMPQGDASFTMLDPVICMNEGAVDLNPAMPYGMFYGPGVSGNSFDPAMAGMGGPYTITRIVMPMAGQWLPPVATGSGDGIGTFSSMQLVQGMPAMAYNGIHPVSGYVASYVRALDSTGTAWETPVTIDPTANSGLCIGLQIADGHPAVVYTEGITGTTTVKYCRALDPLGSAWGSPVILASGPSNLTGLYDACSFRMINGTPAVTYCLAGGVYYILASSADGSTWHSPLPVSSIAGTVRSLDMHVINNRPGIVYNIPAGPDFEMYYTQASGSTGTTWSTPTFIDNTGDRYVSSTVAHGKPAVAYVSNTGSLFYKQAADANGGTWPGTTMHLYLNPLSSYIQFRLDNIRSRPAIAYALKPVIPMGSDNVEFYYDESIDADGYNWGTSEWVGSWNTTMPDMRYFRSSLLEVKGKPALSFYQEELMELQYTLFGTGTCGAMSSQTISVAEAPDPSFGGLLPDYCEDDPAATLTPETAGGVFSGAGVSGNIFLPSSANEGYHAITYTVSDNGCEATQTQHTMVRSNGDASFSGLPPALCTSGSPVTLLPVSPGGVFSGPGVSGNSFDPSSLAPGGAYNITYQLTSTPDNWPVAFNPLPGMSGSGADMEIISGHPAIVSNYTTGYFYYSRANDAEGNTWSTPLLLQMDNGLHPQLLLVNGNPAVIYINYNPLLCELMYVRANDPLGSSWGVPVALTSGIPEVGEGTFGCKSLILDGRPYLLYDVGDGLHVIHASDVNGDTWGSPYLIHAGKHEDLDIILVEGQPALAYTHRVGFLGSPTCELFYQRAVDYISNIWSAPVSLDDNLNSQHGMSMQMINAQPAIAFCDYNSDIVYMRAADAYGALWPLPQILIPGTDNRSFMQLEIIHGNPALAVQHDDFYGGAFHMQVNYISAADVNGNTWNAPENLSGWNPVFYVHPSIAMEMVQGMPAIMYDSAGDLRYVRKQTGTCAATSVQTVTLSSPVSFSISNSGTNPFCTGNTITLTAIPGTQYAWSSGEITQSITVNHGGDYAVKVDDCSVSDTLYLESSYCTQQVNLKLFIEGYYLGGGLMAAVANPGTHPLVCDTITVQLLDSADYSIAATATGVIHTNGEGQFNFSGLLPMHRYYIVVRHRNSVETWSKYSFLFTEPTRVYDFSAY